MPWVESCRPAYEGVRFERTLRRPSIRAFDGWTKVVGGSQGIVAVT